jgi:serine/threonine protein kinase
MTPFDFKTGRKQYPEHFEPVCRLAEGGMSTVWKAKDLENGQTVALKVLRADSAEMMAKFREVWQAEEGQIALRLVHPNVVRTLKYGHTKDEVYWLAMELVEGPNLETLIGRKDRAVRMNRFDMVQQAARGLNYIHREGLIHRDFCPKNVLFDPEGKIKIIDFGLTIPVIDRPGWLRDRSGTASYMAPEQIRRGTLDQRCDIYSFGISAYEILTSCRPFPARKLRMRKLEQHLNIEPIPITEADRTVPAQLQPVIDKCIAKDPDSRYKNMEEVLRDFSRALRGAL